MVNWKYTGGKKGVVFDNQKDYVKSQDIITQSFDDQRFIVRNTELMDTLLSNSTGIKNVLDVGCRDGNTLCLWEQKGINVIGMDISPNCVKYALSKGRNVILGDAHELSELLDSPEQFPVNYFEKGPVKFDAITALHSLEHCYDPEKVLKEFYKCVNKGGYIAIRVPVQVSLEEQSLKKAEDGSKYPPHCAVFTLKSLCKEKN